jgi:hypothetical protein
MTGTSLGLGEDNYGVEIVTINDIVEINKRLAGYYGYEISFSSGISGFDLDLESAEALATIIQEVVNSEPRSEFNYFKKEGGE